MADSTSTSTDAATTPEDTLSAPTDAPEAAAPSPAAVAATAIEIPAPRPGTFPMSLREFIVANKLDPLWEAGLAAFVPPGDRPQEEWNVLLEEYQARPVQNV